MENNLIGYLLNALDPLTQRQVEAYLAAHPEASARLELLRSALEPLAADSDLGEPPPGLTERTLRIIAEAATGDLPQAPTAATRRSFGSERPPWRRADILVAAVVLLSVISLAIPWVVQLRMMDRRRDNPVHLVECKENLRQFYQALLVYHDRKRNFPNLKQIPGPKPYAGLMVPYLIDQGYLPRTMNVCCPAADGYGICPWTLAELQTMTEEEFDQSARYLNPGYAYNLGYYEQGSYVSLSLASAKPNYLQPVMADSLGPDYLKEKNSLNHDGKGQNVLYADGSVKFETKRYLGDDDIYANKNKLPGAGLDPFDIVLGGSGDIP